MNEILFIVSLAFIYFAMKLSVNKHNKVQYYTKWYFYYVYAFFLSIILDCIFVWKGRDFRNLPSAVKWALPMTRFHGMTWHLENSHVMGTCGKAVIISNHQSSLDILGWFHATPTLKNWIPIGKKETIYYGPVGLLFYLLGTVFLDRRNPKNAHLCLNNAVEVMAKHELKIWLFPEGTRNDHKTAKLLPFKKGAFNIAVTSQSPIIPIVYSPYYFINSDKYIFENGGHIVMRCLDPIPTTGLTMTDVPALTERVHAIVLNAYEQLSKEVMCRFPEAAR